MERNKTILKGIMTAGSVAVALGMSGCLSDDSDGNKGASGQILVPMGTSDGSESNNAPLSAALRPTAGGSAKMAAFNCPDVPGGYEPMADAEIEFLDASNTVVGSTVQADECGEFATNPPEEAVTVRVSRAGFRDIYAAVDNFGSGGSGFASTIPSDWNYRIGSLRLQNDGRLGFNVVDDQRGLSVIGLPDSAIEVLVDGTQVDTGDLSTTAQSNEATSVAMVLDASGSMSTFAYEDPDTGEQFNRYQLTTLATHQFLDNRGANDEVSMTIFDSQVDLINDDWIDQNWTLLNNNGNAANFTFSDSGFTGDDPGLRLITDAFNTQSTVWANITDAGTVADEAHPDTPNVQIDTYYNWGGTTALYDGVDAGLGVLESRGDDRSILVTMGDGGDNSSSNSKQDVIDRANDLGIPVFSVGLAVSGTTEDNLRDLGQQTGGDYFAVDDVDLSNAFLSIQTNIQFQYLLDLINTTLSGGETVTLRLDHNGAVVERDFTVSGS